jgi:CheY-like chemotaxis protein
MNEEKKEQRLPSVLLVEDNQENKDVITYFIRSVCKVDSTGDGPSAIEMAKNKQYELILMDINLGLGMNGLEATKNIRLIPGYENVPIVAVTAYAMVGDKEIFLNAGCTHYISKPFTKQEIIELLSKIFTENGTAA